MIQNNEQLQRTRDALLDLESSLAALHRKKEVIHPDRFALMAEPLVDHIYRLRADIDAYIGLAAVRREEVDAAQGVLREIDLDQRTFIVREADGGPETRCALPVEAAQLLGIAKSALDRRVVVGGTRQRAPGRHQAAPLQVREIDVLGRGGEGAGVCETSSAAAQPIPPP